MSCSVHIQERQTDVLVFGRNKQRKSKFERNVMTDLMIFRFGKEVDHNCIVWCNCYMYTFTVGSVQRLEELCKLTVRQHWTIFKHSMSNLPRRIVEFINSDESDCEIVYPSASDFY